MYVSMINILIGMTWNLAQ